MLLASDIAPDGISTSLKFNQAIKEVIIQNNPLRIIETGTYNGKGSTTVIANAMSDKAKLITIEANRAFYAAAKTHLSQIRKNIKILHGVSVGMDDMPDEVTYGGLPEDIIVDHVNPNKYIDECGQVRKYDQLHQGLQMFLFCPDMVLLDSAGHLGWIEFNYLMNLVKSDFILCLDDTKHFKHYRTAEHIKSDPNWTIIFETEEKFSSLIAKYKYDEN